MGRWVGRTVDFRAPQVNYPQYCSKRRWTKELHTDPRRITHDSVCEDRLVSRWENLRESGTCPRIYDDDDDG